MTNIYNNYEIESIMTSVLFDDIINTEHKDIINSVMTKVIDLKQGLSIYINKKNPSN